MATTLVNRRAFLVKAGVGGLLLAGTSLGPMGSVGASGTTGSGSGTHRLGPELATDWVRTLYDVVMAEGLTPPAAARFYHYTSVAMYEAGRSADQRTMAGQLRGLRNLPAPRRELATSVVLSEAVATVALGLLPAASQSSRDAIAAHRDTTTSTATTTTERPSGDRLERARIHGRRLGAALLEWIALDGYAAAQALPYVPPVGPDMWRSTPPNFGTAIEPHWSMVRPAILRSADEVAPAPPIPFSTEVGSAFHDQAMTTYLQSTSNTADQVAIARFWTDNPRLSGLPSGHWFLLLAALADGVLDLDLAGALEGMAELGVALHDAFLNCWTWKYRYNLIRPISYVQDHVDPTWATVVNTPQFPEYTSGHSVASGAADVVLTRRYGSFSFVDATGEDRNLPARPYSSFTAAAEEAAISRLYGGIHYPMAIENGLTQGREIGHLVNRRLRFTNRR